MITSKWINTLFLSLLLILSSSFVLKEVEGVNLPDTMDVSGKTLVLNGGGLREKFWLDLYVGGLYLEAKSTNANQIISADQSMAIKLHIVSTLITSDKMATAVDEGFTKSSPDKVVELAAKIKQFKDVFLKEAIAENDVYDLIAIPGKGVLVKKNNVLQTTISGLDFKQGLFGIWLCNDPADSDLKEGMLGL